MENIENKVYNFINKNNLLANTSKVYVATSGGADSMALLAFMHFNKTKLGIEVGAVHVNHGIRGITARRDAEFVRDYCKRNEIEFILFDAEADNVEVPKNASEEWARQLRYGYFNSISNEGIKIATAHTSSDQTETILFRLARGGSGLKGLSGIPVARDNFIRPFLCINRAEVEQLVVYYGTDNITDETNLGDDYSRNRIRHYVVPELKRINENAEESISKACERIGKAQAYIEKQAHLQLSEAEIVPGLVYETWAFIDTDEVILDEMLLQLLGNIKVQSEQMVEVLKSFVHSVTQDDTQEIMVGELPVKDKMSIMVTNQYISVRDSSENEDRNVGVGVNQFGLYSHTVLINKINQNEFRRGCTNKRDLCNYADTEKLDLTKCVLRSRRNGDRFKPACRMEGKLVKFMRNIPLAQREAVPVIEYQGKIIWVWGLGFTDGFTPSDSSTNIYKLEWY